MYHVLVFIWVCLRFEIVTPSRPDCYIFFPQKMIDRGEPHSTKVTTIRGCMELLFVHKSQFMVDYNTDTSACNRPVDKDAILVYNANFAAVQFFENCENLPIKYLCIPQGNLKTEEMLDFNTRESCFEACRADSTCMGSVYIDVCQRLDSIATEPSGHGDVFMKTKPCNENGFIPKEETLKTTSDITTTPFLLSGAPAVSTNEKSDSATVQLPRGVTEAGSHSTEWMGTSLPLIGFNTTVTSPLTVLTNLLLAETTTQAAAHSPGSTGHLLSSESPGNHSSKYPTTLQNHSSKYPTTLQYHSPKYPTTLQNHNPKYPTTLQNHSPKYPTTLQNHSPKYPTTLQNHSPKYPTTLQNHSPKYPTTLQNHSPKYPATLQNHSPKYPTTLQNPPSSRTVKPTKIPSESAPESGSSEEADNASETHKPIPVLYGEVSKNTVGLNGRSTTWVSDGIYPGSTETRKQSLLSTTLRITSYSGRDSSEQFGTGSAVTPLDRTTPRRTFHIVESMFTVKTAPLRTVYDDRPSAVVLGSFGLVFLCVLGVLIILSDIRKLKHDIFNFELS